MTGTPSVDDLVAEIERLSQRPDDEGKTTEEWSETLGKGKVKTNRLLNLAYRLGRLRPGQRQIVKRNGVTGMVPVYSFLPPPKKNGKR